MPDTNKPPAAWLASPIGRRAALTLAGAAAIPAAARAEGLPPPPRPEIEAPPGVLPLPRARPERSSASPRSPSPSSRNVDKSKQYFVFFDESIDVKSMLALRRELSVLVEGGVTDITLVISSPGGLVLPALVTYGFIRSLPGKIRLHAQGFVQSAATVLFMAGQERTADHTARFLFHPARAMLAGNMNEEQLQDQLTVLSDVEGAIAQILRERTRLSDAEIARFQRETVTVSAAEAKQYGIVQDVADLAIPGDQKARIVFIA